MGDQPLRPRLHGKQSHCSSGKTIEPIVRIGAVRPAPSSVMPCLFRAIRRSHRNQGLNGTAKLNALRRVLPKTGECVSRIAGKSDSTPMPAGRQVTIVLVKMACRSSARARVRTPPDFKLGGEVSTKTESATPSGVALLSCAGHWPPKYCAARWFLPRRYLWLIRPDSPLYGSLCWRLLLPAALRFLGLALVFPSSRVHHWRFGNCNRRTVSSSLYFLSFRASLAARGSAIWNGYRVFLQKTVDRYLISGSWGNSGFPGRQGRCAGWLCRSAGRPRRFGDRRGARAGRTRANPRHRRSPRPKTLPGGWPW